MKAATLLTTIALALAIACATPEPLPTLTPVPTSPPHQPPEQSLATLQAILATESDTKAQTPNKESTPESTAQPEPTAVPTKKAQLRLAPTKTPTPTPQMPPGATPGTSTPPAIPQTPHPTVPPTPRPTTTDPRLAALQAMQQLPWIQDGTTLPEKKAAAWLETIIRDKPHIATRLINMPFLETHEPTDTGALRSLSWTELDDAESLLSHPSLTGGITDDDTIAVTLSFGERALGGNPSRLLERTLDYHTFDGATPLAGYITITIVSDQGPDPASRTAARVQQELSWIEAYLDLPIPTHNVVIHYGATLPYGAKGVNLQTAIMQPAVHHADTYYYWTRHQLIHYWFHSDETWLDKGVAQALASLLQASTTPPHLPTTAPSCPLNTRIRDLGPTPGGNCLYAVGERLMQTLYNETGYESFKTGMQNLAETGNTPPYPSMTLEHLTQAFSHAPAAAARADSLYR